MTIIIAGTVHLPEGDRDIALRETAGLVAETRTQPGCEHYVWAADPTSPTRLYVFEKWSSVEDLAAHLAGHYYQNMLASLGKYGVSDIDVAKYRIDREEPVYDPQGRPRADFFTE